MSQEKNVRVRFAPSPTGHLHIGGARSAIFNWLFAKHHDGAFLVRIEDTDIVRSKKEYVDSIKNSLEWLSIISDEPFLYQSSRIDEYRKVIDKLFELGLAYPCFCEPKSGKEKELQKGIVSKYDGTCSNKEYTEEDLKRPHAIRFRLPKNIKTISFDDSIRGMITVDLDQLDDFVIWRRATEDTPKGMPTYNFCVVVDDIFMKITHVIRGEDHISNTPKQILIYQALNEQIPQFAHLPLILGPSGGKLSKRDAAVSTIEYKDKGFLADALFNYLVRLGWSHGDQEIFSKEEMVKFFTLDHVGKKGAIFDLKKLLWLNGLYIRKLTYENFIELIKKDFPDKEKDLTLSWKADKVRQLFGMYRERATTLLDLVDDIIALSKTPKEYDISLIKKWLTDTTKILLEDFLSCISEMEEPSHENLLAAAKNICKEREVKLVALAQPLRLALTGRIQSPGVFELLEVIPREESQKRIQNLIGQL